MIQGRFDAQSRAWCEVLESAKRDMMEMGLPEMEVSFGVSGMAGGDIRWGWQTGNPEFHGGAYGFEVMVGTVLDADSDCAKVADGLLVEALDSLAS